MTTAWYGAECMRGIGLGWGIWAYLGGLALFAGIVALIAGVFWWVRRRDIQIKLPASPIRSPEDELALRYARGELSRDEFLQKRQDIRRDQ